MYTPCKRLEKRIVKELFLIKIALLIVMLCGFNTVSIALNSSDYLVDSLPVSSFTKKEISLLDSCLQVYHESTDDTNRINAIKCIVEESWNENIWVKYNDWVHEEVTKKLELQNSKRIERYLKKTLAESLNNTGFFHDNKSEIEIALIYYYKSLKIQTAINDKKGMAHTYNNIGIIHQKKGSIVMALDLLHKSLKLKEEIQDMNGAANTFYNIGCIYQNQGDLVTALDYYHNSLISSGKILNERIISDAYNNIGLIHEQQGDLVTALDYLHKALNLKETIQDDKGKAYCLRSIGMVYEHQGKLKEALSYFEKSLDLSERIGEKTGVANSLNRIAYVTLKEKGKNSIPKALALGKRSLAIAKNIGAMENIRNSSELLFKIYEMQDNDEKALEMYKLFIQIRDSLHNDVIQRAMYSQEFEYQYEKQKALDDKEHEKHLAIDEKEKARQKVVLYAISGGFFLVIILLFIIVRNYKKQQRDSYLIQEKNEELNQYNEEILAQKDQIDYQKKIVEDKNKDILSSIFYAKRIQDAILPSDAKIEKILPNSFFLYKPKEIVSGDFYWMEEVGDRLFWAAVDCTGHGVPGAFMSIVGANGLKSIILDNGVYKPSEILNLLTEYVINSVDDTKDGELIMDGMDIALCCLNKKERILEYSGAYNPLYLIRQKLELAPCFASGNVSVHDCKDKKISKLMELKATYRPVGSSFFMEENTFENHEVQLYKGDCLYIFTDGFADQFGGAKNKKFGYLRFRELLFLVQDETMKRQKEIMNSTFEQWMEEADEEQIDDVCVIGVKID